MEIHKSKDQQKNSPDQVLNMDDKNLYNPVSRVVPENRSLHRLNFSKPKSRFTEINYPLPHKLLSEPQEFQPSNPSDDTSSSDDDEDWCHNGEDDENVKQGKYRNKKRKVNRRALIEWSLFLIIMTCLICSLTVESFKHTVKWGLEIWKLCLMVMVLFCGHLVSGWLVRFLVFLVERNFMLRERVLYFIYGLRNSFRNCLWLALVVISWICMFPNMNHHNIVMKKVFLALVAVLIGATIWMIKILLVKVLASSFHVTTFFDRMKETVFHHYILDALSYPPIDNYHMEVRNHQSLLASKSLPAKLQNGSRDSSTSGTRRPDIEKLKKLSMRNRASAWSVKRLANYIMSSGLSTISRTVDDFKRAESEMTSEWGARNCAQRIFKNVAKPGAKYIEEEDLLKYLKSDEVYTIFPLFEGAMETGRISRSSFKNWVVHAYVERKALAHSLNDTKTAVHQLHKLASAFVSLIIIVQALLVLGLATTKVIFLVTSQLLLVGFMFQNTGKTIFESIIFVFAMHPFDVGDRCVIDGVQMIVEEMNILTTVFLRYDAEKIYYPNSVLLTKPISNFRRSPDMGDVVEFTIDVSTPMEDIDALKRAIQAYIESKPKYWNPQHSVVVKEIENIDKLKMALGVKHTMNHQNFGEKVVRRSELLLELKKIFESLGIKYHLLPLEVKLNHVQNL